MDQLAELTDILDASGIEWWVNFGTLLGLVRDGGMLPSDPDIDIECFAGPEGWERLKTGFEDSGYAVREVVYSGMVYKWWIMPKDRRKRSVDLHILRRDDGDLWYPARVVMPPPLPAGSFRRWLIEFARLPVRYLWSRAAVLDGPVAQRLVRRLGLVVNTVRVPARFYEQPPIRLDISGIEVPVPASYVALLEHRYGDWTTPATSWDYTRDDPTHRWQRPPRSLPTEPLARRRAPRRSQASG